MAVGEAHSAGSREKALVLVGKLRALATASCPVGFDASLAAVEASLALGPPVRIPIPQAGSTGNATVPAVVRWLLAVWVPRGQLLSAHSCSGRHFRRSELWWRAAWGGCVALEALKARSTSRLRLPAPPPRLRSSG